MIFILSISIRKIDPSNLQISKLFFNLFFLLVFLFFAVPIDIFENNIKIRVLENSCLNRWFNLVYFKVALLSYSGARGIIGVTGFLLLLVVILK